MLGDLAEYRRRLEPSTVAASPTTITAAVRTDRGGDRGVTLVSMRS
jgi:hypothetical protein